MFRKTLRRLPAPVRTAMKKAYYVPVDALYRLRNPGSLIPPPSMNFVGSGNYKAIGEEFLGHFVKLGGLQPTDRVLDIGCGIGRMAVPLTAYLTPQTDYRGFDIVAEGIAWATRHITSRHPNFRFLHSDVFNQHYNAQGTQQAATYVFPFDDNGFDFAFMTSVCTHLTAADMENYVRQTARMLKPGGRAFITFFLLNSTGTDEADPSQATKSFAHDKGGYRVESLADPEFAVGYDEARIRALYESLGLRIREPIYYGQWSGYGDGLSYQDIVVAEKV